MPNIAGLPPMVEQGQRSLGGSRLSHRATCRSELHEAGTWPTLEAGRGVNCGTARRRATHPRRASKTACSSSLDAPQCTG
jgi:hypothetical protein